MSADTFWILIPSLLIALLAWVVSNTRSVRLATLQAEIQRALINKISSTAELQAYIDSAPGLRLFGTPGSGALERAVEAIRTGVILFLAGIALGVWSALDSRFPVGICLVVTALGVGFLTAGVVTRYLAERWGLLDRFRDAGADPNAR